MGLERRRIRHPIATTILPLLSPLAPVAAAEAASRPAGTSLELLFYSGLAIVLVTILGYLVLRKERTIRRLRGREHRVQEALKASRQTIWEWDAEQDRLIVDAEWLQALGFELPSRPLSSEEWLDFVHDRDREHAIQAFYVHQWAGLEHFDCEYRLSPDREHWLWIHSESKVLARDRDGLPLRLIGILQDVSPRRSAERLLERNNALLHALIDSIPDLIAFKDLSSSYLGCNSAFARLCGRPEREIVGRTDLDLFPPELAGRLRTNDREMLNQGEARQNEEWATYPDGRRVLLDTLKTPFFGPDGEVLGLIGISRDITERHRREEELSKLSAVVRQSPLSIVITDPDGRIEYANPASVKAYGRAEVELVGRQPQLARDAAPDADLLDEILATVRDGRVWRGTLLSGARRDPPCWTQTTAAPISGPGGNLTHVMLTMEDVTERKRLEDRLRESELFLNQVIEGIIEPILVIDRDYRVVMGNQAARVLNAIPPAKGEKGYCYTFTHRRTTPCEGEDHRCAMEEVLKSGTSTRVVHPHYDADGRRRMMEVVASPWRSGDGEILGIIETSRDITERLEAEQRLDYLAHHDPLTGLPNRDLFMDRLRQAIAFAQRNRTRFALLFIDLDRFKPINDNLGHNYGDQALIEVAQRLRGLVREVDTVARMGGDEFTLILEPVGSAEDAERVAAKLVDRIALPLALAGRSVTIGASVGIALYPDHGDEPSQLLHAADGAMYRAKEAGRNRFVRAAAPVA